VPEGDTVWRTAQRLHTALAGDAIIHSDLRWPDLATVDLTGARTVEVVSRGKHLLHRLDTGATLHSHLRMDGSWRIEASGSQRPGVLRRPGLRVVLGTITWTALGDRLGMLDLVATTDEDTVVGHLGPDVLGPDWDPATGVANLAASTGTIGAALLDQRNIAGVGTFWAAETLFLERIDPWAPTAELTPTDLAHLVDRVHRLMDVGRRHAVQASTGVFRRDRRSHVYGRARETCRRCGTDVALGRVGSAPEDRVMFYCPTCQQSTGRPRAD
jgi:endonuclease-8